MIRLIFLGLFLFHQTCLAQLLTNNGIQIYINPGVQLSVKGDIQNNPGTVIENNGTIDLTGDWINNSGSGIFGTSAGTVIMNGLNQDISGTGPTLFYNLHLTNATKTLQADASTGANGFLQSGVLDCNDAVLDLNSHTLSINNPDAGAIIRTSGYILSEDADNLSRVWWTVVSTGIHAVPFGNAAAEDVSFSFTCLPPPGITGGSLIVSTYATAADNTPYPVAPVMVTTVNNAAGTDNSANMPDRFWHIEKTGIADYYFRYAPSENAANGNVNLRAQQWNAAFNFWIPPLPGQTNPSANEVLVQGVPTPDPYTMHGGSWVLSLESSPLPVELLFFDARATEHAEVNCSWSTASEINNDYFIVERSRDGTSFEEAGVVDGSGNSTTVLNYQFTDKNPFPGISYYRLKQVDFDGSAGYSQVVSVQLEKKEFIFTIYPNPASTLMYLQFGSETPDHALYEIKDFLGKTIIKEIIDPGILTQPVPLDELANGLYLIEIYIGENIFSKKVEVSK